MITTNSIITLLPAVDSRTGQSTGQILRYERQRSVSLMILSQYLSTEETHPLTLYTPLRQVPIPGTDRRPYYSVKDEYGQVTYYTPLCIESEHKWEVISHTNLAEMLQVAEQAQDEEEAEQPLYPIQKETRV